MRRLIEDQRRRTLLAGAVGVWLLGVAVGVGLFALFGNGGDVAPPSASGGGPGHLGSARVADAEDTLGLTLPYSRTYASWQQPIHVVAGHTPVLSVLVTGTTWATVASGAQDATIRRQAGEVARIPGSVYLAFHHEPEDNPALGTPADYIAAWRHYVAVYRATGVRNVRWTWIMMADSFRTGRADAFYPGDDIVQVVAADGYNWVGVRRGDRSRTFEAVFADFHAFGLQHHKQQIIAEFGMASRQPGLASWINDASATLRSWPAVIAELWFNQNNYVIRQDAVPALRAMARGSS